MRDMRGNRGNNLTNKYMGNVSIGKNLKKDKVFINARGDVLDPKTKQIIESNVDEEKLNQKLQQEAQIQQQNPPQAPQQANSSFDDKIAKLVEAKLESKIDEIVNKKVNDILNNL